MFWHTTPPPPLRQTGSPSLSISPGTEYIPSGLLDIGDETVLGLNFNSSLTVKPRPSYSQHRMVYTFRNLSDTIINLVTPKGCSKITEQTSYKILAKLLFEWVSRKIGGDCSPNEKENMINKVCDIDELIKLVNFLYNMIPKKRNPNYQLKVNFNTINDKFAYLMEDILIEMEFAFSD